MSEAGPAPRNRHRFWLTVALLWAVEQAVLWWLSYDGGRRRLLGDEWSYAAWARDIAVGGPWMPSDLWPPLQSLLLAGVQTLFGEGLLPFQILQTAMLVVAASLLHALWRQVGPPGTADLAAALFLLDPNVAAVAHYLWPEPVHLLLQLLLFLLVASPGMSARRAIAVGITLGLALLAKNLLLAFTPVLLIFLLRTPGSRLRRSVAFVIGLLAVIGPALFTGWQRTGRPMIADSSLLNLYIGLVDRARSDYVEPRGQELLEQYLAGGATRAERDHAQMARIRELIRTRGTVRVLGGQLGRQYFRLFSAKTLFVTQLPGERLAGRTSSYRGVPGWAAKGLAAIAMALHAGLLTAAAVGMWTADIRRPPVLMVALFIGYHLALFLFLHAKARYLLPCVPLLWGLAASGLATLTSSERRLRVAGPKWVGAAASATILLAFAFAGPWIDQLQRAATR